MSYNPNKDLDTKICRGVETLFEALKRKGIILKGLELSKPLTLNDKELKSLTLNFGPGYNRRHIKIHSKR